MAPVAQADSGSSPGPDADTVKAFRAEVTKQQVPLLLAAGQDGWELGEQAPEKGTATVEVYLTDKQAQKLEKQGVELDEHTFGQDRGACRGFTGASTGWQQVGFDLSA